MCLFFCAVTLILNSHGIKAILIEHITSYFLTLNLKKMHFLVVNKLCTPGTFIDMIRKGNYPIILNVELKKICSF